MEEQPTTSDEGRSNGSIDEKIDRLAVAVKAGFDAVEERFDGIDGRLDGIDGRLDGMDGRLDGMDGRLGRVEERLSRVESTMVTKSYLDEKLGELKGDLIVKMRKIVGMIDYMADVLQTRSVFTVDDVRRMREEYQVFPRLDR